VHERRLVRIDDCCTQEEAKRILGRLRFSCPCVEKEITETNKRMLIDGP
jgi:hypothetical protein